MRITFQATEAGFDDDISAIICGVACGTQYLTFQRDRENSDDDWGIYLEYCDQSNSGYGCVGYCRLSPKFLTIDLCRKLGRLAEVDGFDMALSITPEAYLEFKNRLNLVFRGYEGLIQIESP